MGETAKKADELGQVKGDGGSQCEKQNEFEIKCPDQERMGGKSDRRWCRLAPGVRSCASAFEIYVMVSKARRDEWEGGRGKSRNLPGLLGR